MASLAPTVTGAGAAAGVATGVVEAAAGVGLFGPAVFAASPSLSVDLDSSTVPAGFGLLSFGALGSKNLAGTPRAAIPDGPT
jgi:hypothetical protein